MRCESEDKISSHQRGQTQTYIYIKRGKERELSGTVSFRPCFFASFWQAVKAMASAKSTPSTLKTPSDSENSPRHWNGCHDPDRPPLPPGRETDSHTPISLVAVSESHCRMQQHRNEVIIRGWPTELIRRLVDLFLDARTLAPRPYLWQLTGRAD